MHPVYLTNPAPVSPVLPGGPTSAGLLFPPDAQLALPTSGLAPRPPLVPRVPAALPAVVRARFPFVRGLQPTLPLSAPMPQRTMTSAALLSLPESQEEQEDAPRTSEKQKTDLLFVRPSGKTQQDMGNTRMRILWQLNALPDGGQNGDSDREIVVKLLNPDMCVSSIGIAKELLELACRKNCPMTVMALLSRSGVHRSKMVDEYAVTIIENSGIIFRDDVSLPNASNGCYNALHVACEGLLVRVAHLLITKFGFSIDVPRYDGLLPEEILWNKTDTGTRITRVNKMLEILKSAPRSTGKALLLQAQGSETMASLVSPVSQHVLQPEMLPSASAEQPPFAPVQVPPPRTTSTSFDLLFLPCELQPVPTSLVPASCPEPASPIESSRVSDESEVSVLHTNEEQEDSTRASKRRKTVAGKVQKQRPRWYRVEGPLRRILERLDALPDNGRNRDSDREIVKTFVTFHRYVAGEDLSLEMFELACRKNCHMMAMALLSKSAITDERAADIIENSGIVFREDVSLPNVNNGCYNALHVACECRFVRVADLLVTQFGFSSDIPRYDGLLPEEIVRDLKRSGRGVAKSITALLEVLKRAHRSTEKQ
jgi:hypothetical protein